MLRPFSLCPSVYFQDPSTSAPAGAGGGLLSFGVAPVYKTITETIEEVDEKGYTGR